jgi:hypothetical protein
VFSWQVDGQEHRYSAPGIPVCTIESSEHVAVLTSKRTNARLGLRFVLYLRSGPGSVNAPDADKLKPHHLKIVVPRFEVSGGDYSGQIASAELTYAPRGESLIGFFDG